MLHDNGIVTTRCDYYYGLWNCLNGNISVTYDYANVYYHDHSTQAHERPPRDVAFAWW